MTYDYELRLKPWRELTLLADFIDTEGLHFNNAILHYSDYNYISSRVYYAIDTGFMGVLAFFNQNHKQIHSTGQPYTGCFDYCKYVEPNIGDAAEDHY